MPSKRKSKEFSCLGVLEKNEIIPLPVKIYNKKECVDYKRLVGETTVFFSSINKNQYNIKILDCLKKQKRHFLIVQYKNNVQTVATDNFINYANISNIIKENPNNYYKEGNYWVMTIPLEGRINSSYFEEDIIKTKFTADEELLNCIKNSVWYVGKHKTKFYIQTGNYNKTGKTAKLHQIVCKKENEYNFIDHINGDTFDNRIENLKEVDPKQNSRNKKGVGFPRKNHNKWLYEIRVDGYLIHTPSKSYKEADIDALIVQKYFNYKHRIDEWYKIDKVNEDYKKELINFMENKLKEKKNKQYTFTKNEYSLEELKGRKMIRIFDGLGNSTIVDEDCKYIIDKGRIWYDDGYWRITIKKENYKLHRYLLGIVKTNDRSIQVDHLNQKPSDNRLTNLIITTPRGNYLNKNSVSIRKTQSEGCQVGYFGYWEHIKNHNLINKIKTSVFKTEEEAILEAKKRKWLANHIRPQFKTYQDYLIFKEEYELNNTNNLSIDDYWIQTRFPDINSIKIPKFDIDKL